MDLFASAGIDLPRSGGPGRRPAAPRSLRAPLFAYKVVEEAIRRCPPFDEAIVSAAADYSRKVRGLKAAKEKTFQPCLHRRSPHQASRLFPHRSRQALHARRRTHSWDGFGRHRARAFPSWRRSQALLAPFELKGPDTKDLDHIMPGRGKTPVQQAWEYANDAPGAKWVLVSNCVEMQALRIWART